MLWAARSALHTRVSERRQLEHLSQRRQLEHLWAMERNQGSEANDETK